MALEVPAMMVDEKITTLAKQKVEQLLSAQQEQRSGLPPYRAKCHFPQCLIPNKQR